MMGPVKIVRTFALAGTGLAALSAAPADAGVLKSAPVLEATAMQEAAPAEGDALLPPPVSGTAGAPPPALIEPAEQSKDIVVTGSRLASGFTMPTPVAALSNEQLMQTAPNSLAEGLRQVPALATSVVSSASGSGSANSGTNGQSTLNLRSLGAQRTLVMLDGQRLGVTNVVNSVDINIIPQNLIKRVDVVTGGASASYGSDAVAGVVNFILDSHFEGLKAEASGGITTYGDAPNGHFSLAFGRHIGDSSRLVASVDVYHQQGIKYGVTGRSWMDNGVGEWPNTAAGAKPTLFTLPGVRSALSGFGGTISAVQGCPTGAGGDACRALAGQQFLSGGAIAPFNKGTNAGSVYTQGGDGAIVTNGLSPDTQRESGFLHFEHDVSPNVTLWVEGTYSRNWTRNQAEVPYGTQSTAFTIYEGNPYLPAAVASVFAATPGNQTFTLQKYFDDLGYVTVKGITTVKRGAAGAKGRLWDGWTFDTAFSYQNSYQQLDVYNSLQRNFYAAADAVTDPATGKIVCRSTLLGYDPGCVPMNLFGPNTVSDAAKNYVMAWNKGDTTLNLADADLNVRGNLGDKLNFGAGPISLATGASWRRQTAKRTVDASSAIYLDFTGIRGYPSGLQGRYGGYQFYNPSPLQGTVDVTEGYLELGVPILRDKPFFKSLAATLAGRVTDYSQSGIQKTWKLGANWTVDDTIRFRGTISSDIRAPSVLELFNSASAAKGTPILPYSNATSQITGSGINITTGNPNLKPEKAKTYTGGLVFSPTFLPGLQASIDYYKIKIRGSILTLSAQNVIDGCYAGNQAFCSQITVDGRPISTTTGITAANFVTVTTSPINYAVESTSGIDIETAYGRAIGAGRLDVRVSGNYLLTAKQQSTCTGAVDLVDDIGSCGDHPRFTGRLGATYTIGRVGLFAQERFISAGKKNKVYVSGVDITDNHVPAVSYTDLNFTYTVGKVFNGSAQLFLNITNLFDRDPPPTLSRNRSWIEVSELGLYDALGRRFVAGVRLKM